MILEKAYKMINIFFFKFGKEHCRQKDTVFQKF